MNFYNFITNNKMESITFMPNIYYKTMYCPDYFCNFEECCFYAHAKNELRSYKDSVPVVTILKKAIKKRPEEVYFDKLEKDFVERNTEFFL
jgi:hypothetical protein